MIQLAKHVFEPLRKDENSVLYRGRRGEEQVLVLAPGKADPGSEGLKRLEHEYSLKDDLDSTWAVRPIELTFHWNRPVLVLEDPGGELLETACGRMGAWADGRKGSVLDLPFCLRVGINLANAINHLHDRGVIHKDIKPANVLVNSATGNIWLTGFGIASRLPRERQSPDHPELIAGTLAYMAPEQTGRMNRSIDSRSDLYSYGVTLYELLTGSPPFTAADAMEWVHCHVARRPVPLDERGIPRPISAIIMRLLAKTAEDRYQTATGVESDLRRCLANWEKLGRIYSFSIGTRDVSDRLWIPEKLYGRDREVKVLLAAFERVVRNGSPRLALVSGYSGIGKSSVVNELQKAIVLPRGLFIAGKFDQHRRDIPYATLAQAFQTLVRHILSKSEAEVDYWRTEIAQAVGPNGQLIIDLIPELELIIGKQPPVPELPPQETQNRFQAVFRRFLCVFAQKEHPLTLFLDDLQWLDVATLSLIKHLLSHLDVKYLLIVGAYRDNEVSPSHPLMLTLDSIRKAGVAVDEMVLKPLSLRDVNHFIADALCCDQARSETLARLVHEKTAGNPFFVIQFLTALAEEHLVEFEARKRAWHWDLTQIQARGFTDNVVELMISKLRRLAVPTQEVLKQLACFGDNAKTTTLAIVNGKREEEIDAAIWQAVHAGLAFKLPGSYKFLHDRVQEAAYALIPPQLRSEVHLRIGRVLIERMSPKEVTESIFDVVNQLNRAIDLVRDPEERLLLLRLNVVAGMKARAAIAYTSARNYFALAEGLLSPEAWSERYRETFDLYLAFSECEYLTGNFPAADKLFDLILDRALSNLDCAKVYGLRMKLYQVAGKYDDGVTVAIDALRLVGVTFPESDEEIQSAAEAELAAVPINLRGRQIGQLVDAPLTTDETVQAIINLLVEAMPCAYIGRPKLFPLITPKAVNYSLRYGNTDQSSFAYCVLGLMLVSTAGDLATGFQYSEMSLRLNEKLKNPRLRGTLLHLHGDHINFWRRHFSTGMPILDQAFRACLEVGDLVYAGFLAFETVWQAIEKGDPLPDVLAMSMKYAAFAQESHNDAVYETIRLEQQFVASLQGRTRHPMSFEDDSFDEEAGFAAAVKATFGCGIVFYHIMKQVLAFVHGRYTDALGAAARAEPVLGAAMAMPIEATYHFIHALTLAALYPNVSSVQQAEYRRILEDKLKKHRLWAENCPENYGNRYALLSAEVARIEGRDLDAMHLYEDAIQSARANGFIQNEAIIHEVAARFYAARGFETFAQTYIRNARFCYLCWGATGKVRQIDQDYPLLQEDRVQSSGGTIETPVERLDLGTVVKVSQAISREIVLEQLVQTLMTIAVEHAGAERGLLILPYGEEHRIAAEARTGSDRVKVQLQEAPVTAGDLPDSLLRYVIRTQESVILEDALVENLFSEDDYIRRQRPRSILCLPLVKQARLMGVVYLENNLATGVFTGDRLAVLELLASQAAISLDHARLYADLIQENNDRRKAEEALRASEERWSMLAENSSAGIALIDPDGRFTAANPTLQKMLGYTESELQALTAADISYPEDRAATEARIMEAHEGERRVHRLEKRYQRKDGKEVWVDISSVFVPASGSNSAFFSVVIVDITKRKRAEEKLHQQEVSLREAQTELAHVSRVTTMGELTASIAHEVNQPLAGMLTNANAGLRWLAGDAPNLVEAREAFRRIARDGNRAGDVIARVRTLFKKAPPAKEPLNINLVIQEVLTLVQTELKRNRVSLQTEFANDLPMVTGDKVQLQQVVLNLVVNAIEAMSGLGDGVRQLSVSSQKVSETASGQQLIEHNALAATKSAQVLITVRDSGPGLDPAESGRIFETFYTTKSQGMGMGLAISRSIINAHDGHLWVTANAPRGAIFQFTLPMAGNRGHD